MTEGAFHTVSMALASSREIRQVQYSHLLLGAIGRLKVCSSEVNVKGVEGEEESLERGSFLYFSLYLSLYLSKVYREKRRVWREEGFVSEKLLTTYAPDFLNAGMNKPLLSGTISCFCWIEKLTTMLSNIQEL